MQLEYYKMNINNVFCNVSFLVIVYNSVHGTFYELVTNFTTIIGRKYYTIYENIPYAVFHNIPYAVKPLDHLRFKPPEGLQIFKTQGVYDFSKEFYAKRSILITEDCLHLSVYMPISDNTTCYPVAVWVYEGSYEHGHDFLIEEYILIVVIKFRTSILGFLNTNDDFAKGNMGAKDVLMSLKWIRTNIHNFNGDLNRVTVIGSGDAANIVASLLVSSAAEDLFARVIIHGGSALSPKNYGNYNLEIIKKLHWRLYGNLDNINKEKLYQYLRTAPVEILLAISHDMFDSTEIRDRQKLTNAFGCTIESDKNNSFVHTHPLKVYKRKLANYDVDVMFGYSNFDALYKLKNFINKRILLKYLNFNFQYLLPFFGKAFEYDSERYKNIQRRIKNFYFINGTITKRSFRRYIKYHTDQVVYPLVRQARLQCERSSSNVYLYRFIYNGRFNTGWLSLPKLHWSGATSGDEICYQFKCEPFQDDYTSAKYVDEKRFIKKMARLMANFIKFGNPTPKTKDTVLEGLLWEPLRINKTIKVLNMGMTLKMINMPEQKRIDFWDNVKDNFFEDA